MRRLTPSFWVVWCFFWATYDACFGVVNYARHSDWWVLNVVSTPFMLYFAVLYMLADRK